jgi:hypothetical protein
VQVILRAQDPDPLFASRFKIGSEQEMDVKAARGELDSVKQPPHRSRRLQFEYPVKSYAAIDCPSLGELKLWG